MKPISSLLIATFATSTLLAVSSAPIANSPQPKVSIVEAPGAISATTTIITTVIVQKIDPKTRVLTLKKENGEVFTFTAPEDVRNFAQIKVGDIVTTQLTDTLDLRLIKGASQEIGRSVQESSTRAKLGEKPNRSETMTIASRVKVIKIDPATQTITYEGQRGKGEAIVKNPDQFKLIAVDDMIDMVATETIAISVSAPVKKK